MGAGRALRLLLLLVMALAAWRWISPQSQPSITNVVTSNSVASSTATIGTTKSTPPVLNATEANRKNTIKTGKENRDTPLLITKITGIKDLVTTEYEEVKDGTTVPLCDAMPPDLGPITANTTEIELNEVEKKYPEVWRGGRYAPRHCTARHRVAIIVPYRNRKKHLAIFLNHMHPFLMKQQLDYGIFIIEQFGAGKFNRAKLLNVGFVVSEWLRGGAAAGGGWQCFVFHDADLLPLDERNLYSCPRQPRHMSVANSKHHYKLIYEELFGGVTAMTKEQFITVNGFSNKFWGWGGEDDDMVFRIRKSNYHIARYKFSVARYVMLHHEKQYRDPNRYSRLQKARGSKDGLSSLTFELLRVAQHHLYTHVIVNIDEKS